MIPHSASNRSFFENAVRVFFLLLLFCTFVPLSFGQASEGTGPAEDLSLNIQTNGDLLPSFPPVSVRMEENRAPAGVPLAQSAGPVSRGEDPAAGEPGSLEEEVDIPDPLESVNRAFFQFNDRLYFYALKPVAQGYKAVVPEKARVGVRNFFNNILFPVRFVNCLLQGKVEGAANEFANFMLNSTFGIAGFIDITKGEIPRHREDLGQTFGVYGVGPGFFIVWPFLGPSTLRDSVGMAGDSFLNPFNYTDWYYSVGARAYDTVNETSLSIGDYEAFKNAALDPYISMRSAYYQNRAGQIKK